MLRIGLVIQVQELVVHPILTREEVLMRLRTLGIEFSSSLRSKYWIIIVIFLNSQNVHGSDVLGVNAESTLYRAEILGLIDPGAGLNTSSLEVELFEVDRRAFCHGLGKGIFHRILGVNVALADFSDGLPLHVGSVLVTHKGRILNERHSIRIRLNWWWRSPRQLVSLSLHGHT